MMTTGVAKTSRQSDLEMEVTAVVYSRMTYECQRKSSCSNFSSMIILSLEEFDDDLANIFTSNISSSSNADDENILDNRDSIVSVDRDQLQRISLLGRGRYCNVHLVAGTLPLPVSSQHQSTSEKAKQHDQDAPNQKALFACKSIDPTGVNGHDEWIIAASELANEAKILSDLDHKNIIKLRALCSERFSESFGCDSNFFHRYKCRTNNSTNGGGLEGFFLVTDVLTETLADRLNRWRKSNMNLKQSKLLRSRLSKLSSSSSSSSSISINVMYERIETVLLGIARGMEYLSSQNIVLRDLKPMNVGFDNDQGVKLFDFGFARNVEECDPTIICGSPRYLAPEVVAGKGYSLKVDVYSFGVMFFEVCSLKVPFKEYFDNDGNSKRSFSTLSWGKKLVKTPNRCRSKKNSDHRLQQHQVMLNEFYRRVTETELRPMDDLEPPVLPCPLIRSLIKEYWHTDAEKRPTFQEIVPRLEALLEHQGRISK
jgi:serine/threonine protein kinase